MFYACTIAHLPCLYAVQLIPVAVAFKDVNPANSGSGWSVKTEIQLWHISTVMPWHHQQQCVVGGVSNGTWL